MIISKIEIIKDIVIIFFSKHNNLEMVVTTLFIEILSFNLFKIIKGKIIKLE